jgi:hypothetical protein
MPRLNTIDNQDLLGKTKSFNYNDSSLKTIREMLQEVDIIEILETEYDLFFATESNGWFNTNCPLPGHDDSSPSFGVNRDKGTFHCFGCGASGDLISFIRKMEGLGFKQALERVMIITGINPDLEASQVYRALRDINSVADDYLNYQVEYDLPGGISPVQYLRSLAQRLKKFEAKTDYDSVILTWIDKIYEQADNYVMKEDYSNLKKLWKNLGNDMKDKLNQFRGQENV